MLAAANIWSKGGRVKAGETVLELAGLEVTWSSLALGTITGMTYGILAVGLILIYRSNKIINFAHGEIGAFSAAVFGALVTRGELHYWLAFPVAIAFGSGLGALTEFGAVRRLRNAPAVMSAVVTLALAGVLVTLTTVVNVGASAGYQYPLPRWFPEFFIGGLLVTQAHTAMLLITPFLVAGLTLFLQRSRFGMGIRASAANSDAARLAAVPVAQMSTLAWAIAGGVSAYTAILIFPTRGFVSAEVLGPSLLLRALTAAVIARMTSLPIGFAAGIGIGILEHFLLWNFPRGGLISAVLFVLILVALLLQTRTRGRSEDRTSWSAVQPWKPLPDAARKLWAIRNLGPIAGGAALVGALLLPVVVTHSISILLVGLVAFALVGLSLGITTGLGGQLSLGQFAVAGVGATASFLIGTRTGAFAIGLLAAGIAGSLVSLLIGLPALRIRSLMLTVTTLGFALAAQDWFFRQEWMLGAGVDPGRPILFGIAFDSGKSYYVFAVCIVALCTWLTRNVWRSGVARRLRAVRDNEDAARSFTIPVTRLKLQGFLLAGFLAGVGGAVYGHSLSQISSTTFLMAASIDVAMLSVVGGIGVLAGPIVGALFVIGVPLLPLDNAGLAATKLGLLLLVLYFPGGVAEMLRPLRDAAVRRIARRAGVDVDAPIDESLERRPISLETLADGRRPTTAGATTSGATAGQGNLLEVTGAVKHYGGIKAVDGVSLQVARGETVGLIGPNGAGKTTLFELIGGFVPSDDGTFVFDSHDVTKQGAESRGRLGLIRSFQDAALFGTMTTLEVVMLAMERTDPTRLGRSLIGLHGAEKKKEKTAREHVAAMGLWSYRDKQIRELSTGTRRIVEIASLLVLRPTLLLLDEPSAGIAQREVEALQSLLDRIKRELSLTLLVIEHDVPMIMALSDRIIAMDTGKVIATGTPEEIRTHPEVVRSYLGGDVTTIQRSGVTA
jgi:ABC-type branched-subunit amino acid transport system ATPase component/ABC-type branched-subunit amino acid transport system permease subunit